MLNRAELEAVVAVALSSVALHDVALGTVASACTAQTSLFAWVLSADLRGRILSAPSAYVASQLRDMVRRDQPVSAEVLALEVTRNPIALLNAYEKLRVHHRRLRHNGDPDLWLVESASMLVERMRTIEELYGVPAPAETTR
jgi:hypothetical protein